MNKEELELVLQAIKELGEAGQSAFIWWCILNFASGFITPSAWISIVYVIAKAIQKIVASFTSQDAFINAITGPDDSYLVGSSIERQQEAITILRKHYNNDK